MTGLIAGGAVLLVAVIAFLAGRWHNQRSRAEGDAKIKDKQLEIAADRPASKHELADRVRNDF